MTRESFAGRAFLLAKTQDIVLKSKSIPFVFGKRKNIRFRHKKPLAKPVIIVYHWYVAR